jgi:hypothetical protein
MLRYCLRNKRLLASQNVQRMAIQVDHYIEFAAHCPQVGLYRLAAIATFAL